ncbi:zinc knuckle [Ancylostoma caninum]|uniref:Zinc knuckle n=2 Tax=Ancylostoma caninum TaxID=29170 RepID=A0A368GJU1_ANCCA|nr:zinc knuckle [Ancylostoma caninum]
MRISPIPQTEIIVTLSLLPFSSLFFIGFPFATCFVCGQQGHLSRDCEKNANGIYPDGGGCNVCGSTRHLKRDCPELAAQKQKKDERKVTIRTMSAMSSADADDIPDEEPKEERKKPKKVVRF